MKIILRFLVLSVSIFLLSQFLSGFTITSTHPVVTVLVAALVLTLLNLFIKPIITLLTLPINLITLGLFSLIINALLLWVVAWYVEGFQITNFGIAIVASLIISLISVIFGTKN